MTTLIDALVPDDLWVIVQPLLPPPPRPRWGGRRRTIPDRNCFAAIVYMARTSTPWRLLPAQELGLRLTRDGLAAAERMGPRPGCSSSSTWRSWAGSAWRAGWTGRAPARTA